MDGQYNAFELSPVLLPIPKYAESISMSKASHLRGQTPPFRPAGYTPPPIIEPHIDIKQFPLGFQPLGFQHPEFPGPLSLKMPNIEYKDGVDMCEEPVKVDEISLRRSQKPNTQQELPIVGPVHQTLQLWPQAISGYFGAVVLHTSTKACNQNSPPKPFAKDNEILPSPTKATSVTRQDQNNQARLCLSCNSWYLDARSARTIYNKCARHLKRWGCTHFISVHYSEVRQVSPAGVREFDMEIDEVAEVSAGGKEENLLAHTPTHPEINPSALSSCQESSQLRSQKESTHILYRPQTIIHNNHKGDPQSVASLLKSALKYPPKANEIQPSPTQLFKYDWTKEINFPVQGSNLFSSDPLIKRDIREPKEATIATISRPSVQPPMNTIPQHTVLGKAGKKCSFCQKTQTPNNFKRHQATHNRKIHKCPLCETAVTRLDNLKAHIRQKHPDYKSKGRNT